MNKLSSREKILLVGLLFTALVVGGIFLIVKPVLEERAQNQQILADAKAEKQTLIAQYDMLGILEKNLEQARENAKLKEPDYYSADMQAWEVDKYVVGLLERQNLNVTSLQVVKPSQYFITVSATDENGNPKEDSSTPTDAKVATATVAFSGDVEQVINFVDSIKKLDRQIALRTWSYQVTESKLKGNIIIEVYCK